MRINMYYFQRIGSEGLQKYVESSKDILELYFLELKNTDPNHIFFL